MIAPNYDVRSRTSKVAGRVTMQLDDSRINAAGAVPTRATEIALSGTVLRMAAAPISHASARLEVCFDTPAGAGTFGWVPLRPGTTVRKQANGLFNTFYVRRFDSTTPSTTNTFTLLVDEAEETATVTDEGVPLATGAAGVLSVDTELPDAAALVATNVAYPTAPMVGAAVYLDDGATLDMAIAGAGTAARALRSTLASDDPAVVALQIMDDWDETDRAKVNPIAGQAGVAAGAGAVDALTQRSTEASDSPVTTALQIMDDWDESDRAKVNLIAGQVAVAGGEGLWAANVQRTSRAVRRTYDYDLASIAGVADVVIEITGAAGPVRVKAIELQPSAACIVHLRRNSAAYTGGTLTAVDACLRATGDAAASGAVKACTVATTGGGTLVRRCGTFKLGADDLLNIVYNADSDESFELAASQFLAVLSDTAVTWRGRVVLEEAF